MRKIPSKLASYNYYEIAYHFRDIWTIRPSSWRKNSRALSNPENIDQFHSAIWRLAVERVRHSCAITGDWVAALDAFELALSCPVGSDPLQRHLCDALERQLRKAQDTPINDLVAIYFVQAPISGISANKRMEAIRVLCGQRMQGEGQQASHAAMEFMAVAQSQVMFDDMRQRLQPVKSINAHVEWSNIAVRHDRLSGAVPLGHSLIADIERTKWLLPDLIHEIGHGVALHGHLGIIHSAFRAVTHFLEAYLIDLQGGKSTPNGIRALPSLPDHSFASALAVNQLRAAANSVIAQSVWTPWLEGLSMYSNSSAIPKTTPPKSQQYTSVCVCSSTSIFHVEMGKLPKISNAPDE